MLPALACSTGAFGATAGARAGMTWIASAGDGVINNSELNRREISRRPCSARFMLRRMTPD